MSERPILFTPENAQAIAEGRKTMTRRIIKPQPTAQFMPHVGLYSPTRVDRDGDAFPAPETYGAWDENEEYPCPYGRPGTRLWVRHTVWMRQPVDDWQPHCWNPVTKTLIWKDSDETALEQIEERQWKKIPGIHMPRWAGSTVLELTGVRVERLQEISEEDAVAEGVEWRDNGLGISQWTHDGRTWFDYAVDCYRHLYESINGPDSWARNDWVWVLEFRRVTT